MKFLDWYVKIAVVSAMVGASMELFMVKTGFCMRTLLFLPCLRYSIFYSLENFDVHKNYIIHDKVTVLESEKRAWENSPEAQAIKDALNPWRNLDAEAKKDP